MAIIVGSVVWLKSGGQAMTVLRVSNNGMVQCTAGGNPVEFPAVALTEVVPEPALAKARRAEEAKHAGPVAAST